MDLSISNIVTISLASAGAGAGRFNTSNLACFTSESPAVSFGALGYKIYLSPADVATDFGTTSKTYKAAQKVFSQAPNILANSGYFVVILVAAQIQQVAFTGTAASGVFKLNGSADINWNDNAAAIQTKLRAVVGLEKVVVTGSIAAGSLLVEMKGLYGNQSLLVASANTLQTSAPAAVTIEVTQSTAAEDLAAAITRTLDLVQYFGVGITEILSEVDMLAAAAVLQPEFKIGFMAGNDEADVAVAGKLDKLRSNGYTHSRGLFYDNPSDDQAAMDYQWAYAGRALSVVFSGDKTTQTMHLKELVGVDKDPNITQTVLNLAKAAGADCYIGVQGLKKPVVFCSGENDFFDQVYNALWFLTALQIAGVNYLQQTSTKIPQTEDGMDGLKNAYRVICEQAITNQYGASGLQWSRPDTFGVLADFLQNITQRGYYIYSAPIAQQDAADREARYAPLVQIALKEAGAMHKSGVLVYINK